MGEEGKPEEKAEGKSEEKSAIPAPAASKLAEAKPAGSKPAPPPKPAVPKPAQASWKKDDSVCWDFMAKGSCWRGRACPWTHGPPQAKPPAVHPGVQPKPVGPPAASSASASL